MLMVRWCDVELTTKLVQKKKKKGGKESVGWSARVPFPASESEEAATAG